MADIPMQSQLQPLQPEAPRSSQPGADLLQFLPVAETYVKNMARQHELEHEARMRESDLEEKDMDLERHKFNWVFLLVSAIIVSFIVLAAILMIAKNDVSTGKTILSHIAMFGGGLMAGLGLRHRQENSQG